MKKVLKYLMILFVVLFVSRIAFGFIATSKLSKEDTDSMVEKGNAKIQAEFAVIIAEKIKFHSYYGDGVSGVFEKDASVYYYDGSVIIKDVKALRRVLIKDGDEIIKRQTTFMRDEIFNMYETLPRFYDDIDHPDQEIKDAVESPLIIYILNPLNLIEEIHFVDKHVEYERLRTYERK